jgi:hypothetical protein
MDKQEFVNALQIAVEDGAVSGVIGNLVSPPGRRPAEALKALSIWFNGLSPRDRDNVERSIAEAASATLYGFLCVLDGVSAIEGVGEKGTLELRYRRGDVDVHLNGDDGPFLYEIFKARRHG